MFNYTKTFIDHISQIKSEGRYREFLSLQRIAGSYPYAIRSSDNKKIVMWCINDYLGMSQKDFVINASVETTKKMGTGAGGTRNIGGNNCNIVELENLLADYHNKESGLVFTSGYVANDTSLSTLAKIIPDLVFFSDEDNHSSIIHGIKNSRAEKYVYKHLDPIDLEIQLKKVNIERPKIIVFESIYSMDGLESPISDIVRLAKKYNALTYIDEVHTVGLYGKTGSGIASLRGFEGDIDIIQGTLGKAIGAIGGYITANKDIIDAIRLSAPGFIFTTAMNPSAASASIASISYLRDNSLDREKLFDRVNMLKNKLKYAGIEYLDNSSHIIPIIIGDPIKTKEISRMLLDNFGIFVQHINYPTVKRGTERLRITPTPCHTEEMINDLVDALVSVFQVLDVKQKDIVAA
jgi:5-aminolevulinate synthase